MNRFHKAVGRVTRAAARPLNAPRRRGVLLIAVMVTLLIVAGIATSQVRRAVSLMRVDERFTTQVQAEFIVQAAITLALHRYGMEAEEAEQRWIFEQRLTEEHSALVEVARDQAVSPETLRITVTYPRERDHQRVQLVRRVSLSDGRILSGNSDTVKQESSEVHTNE